MSPHQQGYDFSDGYTGNRTGGSKGSGDPAASPDPKRIDTITDQALHFIDRQHTTANPFLVFHQAVDRNAISAIRLGNFKLVKTWKKEQLELFDLSKDLSESNDLSREHPEQVRKLQRMLTGYLKDVGAETRRTKKK